MTIKAIQVFKSFVIISIGQILVSCSSYQEYDTKEEIKVLNDIFIDLMGTENYNKPLPRSPYPSSLEECKNKQDSLRYLDWSKEFNRLLNEPEEDSLDLVIAFNDTLIFPHYDKEGILNRIKYLKSNISDSIDVAPFLSLMTFLIDSSKYQPRDNILKKITQTGRYKLIEVNQIRKEYPRYKNMVGFRFIGDLSLSRVIFNKDRTYAVFYQDYICGGDCGSGDVIWIKKKNGEWKIVGRINLWVS